MPCIVDAIKLTNDVSVSDGEGFDALPGDYLVNTLDGLRIEKAVVFEKFYEPIDSNDINF